MLLSFKSLFAVLCSHITARKFLAVSRSPLAALKAAKGTCRFELLLLTRAGAAGKGCGCAERPSVIWCFCFEEEGKPTWIACL